MSFTVIDNELLENDDMTSKEKLLLIAIIRYYNQEKGYSYPSYKQLRKISGIGNNNTLIKSLYKLINLGFIQKETLKGRGNKYYLPSAKVNLVQNSTTFKNEPPRSSKVYEDVVQNCTTTNTNTNTNINTNMCIKEKKSRSNKSDVDEIWKLYPNKKGKAVAFNKIQKLLKIHSKEELLRCVERYALETKSRDKQYIKHGSSFFNGVHEDYLDSNYEDTKGTSLNNNAEKRNTFTEDDLW